MAPTTNTVTVFSYSPNGTDWKSETRVEEGSIYWDVGRLISLAFILLVIYLLQWAIKAGVQLLVAKVLYKRLSGKGKQVFADFVNTVAHSKRGSEVLDMMSEVARRSQGSVDVTKLEEDPPTPEEGRYRNRLATASKN